MLVQLHWQWRDSKTEFCAQSEFAENANPNETLAELRRWIKDVQSRHPLPEKCDWMLCTEGSNAFLWAAKEDD